MYNTSPKKIPKDFDPLGKNNIFKKDEIPSRKKSEMPKHNRVKFFEKMVNYKVRGLLVHPEVKWKSYLKYCDMLKDEYRVKTSDRKELGANVTTPKKNSDMFDVEPSPKVDFGYQDSR